MGAFAFVDEVPLEEVNRLQHGAFILTQRLNSFTSWAMLYVTKSSVDHAAIYAGDGNVFHMTLSGSKLHSLRSLAKGARVLILRMSRAELGQWSYETQLTNERIDKGSKFEHSFPPKIQLIIGGLYSIHGKYPDRFNFVLWFEFFLTLSFFVWIVYFFSGLITLTVLPLLSVFFLAYFAAKNLLRSIQKKPAMAMSHPDIGYQAFLKVGGLMFTRMGPITVTDLGLLPLNVILGFARQRTDDSADDKFKETRQFFRDLLKGWNIEGFREETEQDDAEQHKDK